MKRIVYGILATVAGLVLLFSYRTSLNPQLTITPEPAAATGGMGGVASGNGTSGGSGTSSGSGTTTSAAPTATGTLKQGTFTGTAADTPYGPVQVAVEVAGGKITSVHVVQSPNDNGRSRSISQMSLPTLQSETITAQSAKIDMVSGATYTSSAYRQSLQSAIDQAAA